MVSDWLRELSPYMIIFVCAHLRVYTHNILVVSCIILCLLWLPCLEH